MLAYVLPYEDSLIVTAVWLDQFWRKYCPFSQRLFHHKVFMWHSSYVSNLNFLKFCMLSYSYKYIRIRISVLQVDRTIFEGVIGHFEYFIKKYLGGGRDSCFCVTILITFFGLTLVRMKLIEFLRYGMHIIFNICWMPVHVVWIYQHKGFLVYM